MHDSLSSPERVPSVKRTYAGRSKRRQSVSRQSEDMSEDGSSSAEEGRSETNRKSKSPLKQEMSRTRVPKHVDVELPGPGPSPERPSRDTGDTSMRPPSATVNQLTHGRNSSVSSLRVQRAPILSPKPVSSGPKHHRSQSLKSLGSIRDSTPEFDDSVSMAGSAKSAAKIRTTAAQRIQSIQSHPSCGKIEPHRAFCTSCNKWANLGKQQTYSLRMWAKHRSRCDMQPEETSSSKPFEEEGDEEDDVGDDDASSMAASSVARSETPLRRSEPERQAFLESDANIETVEPHKVLCKACRKWIKLSPTLRYQLGNWKSHQRYCAGSFPSNRVTTAERKLKLVNDSQVKMFDSHNAECTLCGDVISLGNEAQYNLTKWNAHKMQCSSTPPIHTPHQVQPWVSVTSTETTAITSVMSPPKQGLKRAHESEGEDEAQPHNRPRTENYGPVEKATPGPWGWFMMPFHAFMSGFRQGMGTSSPG